MENALRPLSVTDVIDAAINLYRRNFVLFAGIVAVLLVPETAIALAVTGTSPVPTYHFVPGQTFHLATYEASSARSAGLGLLGLLVGTLTTGALAYAVSRRYLGRPITVPRAYLVVGWGRFLRLLLATILEIVALIIVLGVAVGLSVLLDVLVQVGIGLTVLTVLLAIVEGIAIMAGTVFLWIRFLLIPQAIVLEDRGLINAFRRSWRLVRGSTWRVLGAALLLYLIVAIVQGVLGGIVGVAFVFGHGTAARLLSEGLSGILGIVVAPVLQVGLTLIYYDLRVRHEGFDLEQLAARIPLEAAPGG